jgi:isopenicillin-N epimerase
MAQHASDRDLASFPGGRVSRLKSVLMVPPPELRAEFLLDSETVYLNHGSFGACPRPVFEAYQRYQLELEREPVQFLAVRAADRLRSARSALAEFVGCQADNLVFFTNPTTALNMVARSLPLSPGDEILATDHEYGALDRTWRFVCARAGADYIRQPIALPLAPPEELVEALWSRVTPRTRAIFVSHITSPTAITFPVEALCQRARQAGILSIVDGAHAPGQVPLRLQTLGADVYAGACHKWLCAPKGSAFLFARREVQAMLKPLVVSWGWEAEKPSGSTFIDHHEWQGTRDLAAFLSVPDAIRFQARHAWPSVQAACHQLAAQARQRLLSQWPQPPICDEARFHQMFAIGLPTDEPERVQQRLYAEYGIEVPVQRWGEASWLRVSIQAYNSVGDIEALLEALPKAMRSA